MSDPTVFSFRSFVISSVTVLFFYYFLSFLDRLYFFTLRLYCLMPKLLNSFMLTWISQNVLFFVFARKLILKIVFSLFNILIIFCFLPPFSHQLTILSIFWKVYFRFFCKSLEFDLHLKWHLYLTFNFYCLKIFQGSDPELGF